VKTSIRNARRTLYLIGGLVFLVSLVILFLSPDENLAVAILFILMVFSMAGLVRFSKAMGNDVQFRLLTELVFWLPGLALFL
jgi:hypothetical protein